MYDQPLPQSILFYMLYGAVAMTNIIACCYLLFRRANAFAPDNTPPVRLRRWAATFFASMALSHLWYIPTAYLTSSDDVLIGLLIGATLDFMLFIPLTICFMLVLLQDRRRPLWPVPLMMVPAAIGALWCIFSRSYDLVPVVYAYLLLIGVGLIIYLFRALRQYGHWLRDNFADLEHKELGQTFAVMVGILITISYYMWGPGSPIYEYVIQIVSFVLTCYPLWRVETLNDLSISQPQTSSIEETAITEDTEKNGLSQNTYDNISSLLQRFCIDTQLYLQHDLTLSHLAQAIGTNRTYLTYYFSSQDTTYNTYINNLRINHFIRLYNEAAASQQHLSIQQMAHDSGYRSYTTFSIAFKQRMGKNVTAWMSETN